MAVDDGLHAMVHSSDAATLAALQSEELTVPPTERMPTAAGDAPTPPPAAAPPAPHTTLWLPADREGLSTERVSTAAGEKIPAGGRRHE